MHATLLILLPTVLYTLVASHIIGGDLADNIFSKNEECDDLKNRVTNVVSDEDIVKLKRYYNKCKDDLDKLKIEYLSKYLLGPSFYSVAFPARLSNGNLIMVSVPSKTTQHNKPDTTSCLSCAGLCTVSEKCLSLLEDINKNTDSTDISYYKMKYKNCMVLLNEQKLKFIKETHLSEDLLKGPGNISLNCKEGSFVINLPESANSSDGGSPRTSLAVAENKKNRVVVDDSFNDNSLGNNHIAGDDNRNKHSEEVYINSIPKKEKFKETMKSERISKLGSNEEQAQKKSYHDKQSQSERPDKDIMYSNNKEFNGDEGTNVFRPRTYTDDIHTTESTKYPTDVRKPGSAETEEFTKKTFAKDIFRNNDDMDKSHLLGSVVQDSERDVNVASYYNNEIVSPNTKKVTPKSVSPYKQLGDEIYKRESDCEEILTEANKVLDYRTFDSVSFYDKKYEECVKYLNLLKRKYASRHGLKLKLYKSLFPIVLSSGVEKLVTLPDKTPDLVQQTLNIPCNQNTLKDELSLQPPKEGTAGSAHDETGDAATRVYGSAQYINTFPINNPAIITNDRFYESFGKMTVGDTMATLVKFVKMVRMNTGHSERNYY